MLTFTIFLAIGISLYVLFPLMVQPSDRLLAVEVAGDDAISMLKTDKELYLKAIKDIDFEYASDKINEDDYKKLKNMYSLKAYDTMTKIEELEAAEQEDTDNAQGEEDE